MCSRLPDRPSGVCAERGNCLARGNAATVLGAGQHGSTFGGNPLACATALTVVNTIVETDLPSHAIAMGAIIKETLSEALADLDIVREIRGDGLMLGIDLGRQCPELVTAALAKGLLINVAALNTVRLLPPLIISADEARFLATGVAEVIRDFAS